ncbi:mechanosensitive ion channel family protein [Parasedimentitalea marina]|uniref:Mechanosensitive ion channel family protein n=1 Tax=Parasedimentitalea marina TaxID=2483033 RepID=A0A3T0N2B2_9RHOB|nr:mechanosensitive ion channel family protein [Parasedimentitalea marina]AZV78129.1 mechanosensitive ion channel family protein [Parasedimentitalea marina]
MKTLLQRYVQVLHVLGLIVLMAFATTAPLSAQSQMLPTSGTNTADTVTLPDPLTPEAIHEMVARMSDDQVRGLLLDRLDAVAAAQSAPAPGKGLIATLEETWTAFYSPGLSAIGKLSHLGSKQIEALSNFRSAFGDMGLLKLFAFMAIAIAAGLAAEMIVNRISKRWQGTEATADDATLWSALGFLARRFGREILGLVAFYVALRTVGLALLSPAQLSFAGPFVTYMIWFPRLGAAVSRFVLAPHRSDLRLVNIDDRWAAYLHRNLIGLVLLGGFTMFIIGFNTANGVAIAETRIAFWLNSAVHIYVALIFWTAREGLTQMMLGTDPDRSRFDVWVASAYPYFAIAVAAVTWVVVQVLSGFGYFKLLLTTPHYTTMFWLLLAPVIDTAIRGLVRHMLPPMIGEGAVAEAAYKATKRSYIKIGRVIAGLIVVLRVAEAWNLDLRNLAAAGVGERFAANSVEFIMTVATGYVIYELVSLYVNRQLAKEQTSVAGVEGDLGGGEGGGAGGSRLTTVLPLALVSAQTAIMVIFGLLAVGSLGIDITPLLAGAGILGLAIGFGAQKLVTDVVSGVFFLIDDAFRVGEYVEVGGTMGTVEKISIRSMQLRHHRGLVHTIPYGEIPKLTNFSRDWVIMKLMFTVPFDTDPNKVKKIFKRIGAEMIADPLYKDDFLEPFKSQGVFQFDDVGIVMRGKFMAKPGTQFTIRKEIYNRVRKEFDANGIEFARREVRVALPGLDESDNLSEADKTAVAAAAGAAVQQQVEAKAAEAAAAKGKK